MPNDPARRRAARSQRREPHRLDRPPGQRELLQKLQPDRWEDLIVDISLFRPGPVKSDMITPYLRRRAALERPVYIHPGVRPALRETFGVIVYREGRDPDGDGDVHGIAQTGARLVVLKSRPGLPGSARVPGIGRRVDLSGPVIGGRWGLTTVDVRRSVAAR